MNKGKLFLGIILTCFLIMGCIEYELSPTEISVNNGNSFTVDVVIDRCITIPVVGAQFCTSTDDVYGVGFDLNYDSSKIRFQSITLTGGILEGDSVITAFRNSSTENGKLVVGISKNGQVSGEDVYGKIATISFQAVGAGSTEITFSDPHMLDSAGDPYVGLFKWAILKTGLVTVN